MSINRHLENREWTFQALDDLEAFLEDPDFEGDAEEERSLLERRRKELREGKYRVVFLGAFNVGKSTLINALLGDEYLPTVLEECTAKITHVLKGETMQLLLNLHVAVDEGDLSAVKRVLEDSGISPRKVARSEEGGVVIEYEGVSAREIRDTLEALITLHADEDYPQLETLRNKFEEIFVYLPNDKLMDDIALVDSPGVYSISETNRRIAHEIIPHSHLVVCLLDSQNAGNEHNSNFIEQIVRHQHRKMFFVINKADQLNPDEIDLEGKRGPARDLLRSLGDEGPELELFFISSLYALLGEQLLNQRITMAALDNNNKVKFPFEFQRRLLQESEPEALAGSHLKERSNFETLRERLHDYLYNENREGAILESVCRFASGRAWRYLRPLEVKLDLVRNVPKLDYLERRRKQLAHELQGKRAARQTIMDSYAVMTQGGDMNGIRRDGYENLIDKLLNGERIRTGVMEPLETWLEDAGRLKQARRQRYAPLHSELEQRIDVFLHEIHNALNAEIQEIERQTLEAAQQALGRIFGADEGPLPLHRGNLPPIQAKLGASYAKFAAAGLVLGGVAGAGLGGAFLSGPILVDALGPAVADIPQVNLTLGGAAGAVLGLCVAVGVRLATSTKALRKRVREQLADITRRVFLQPAGAEQEGEESVREHLHRQLSARRERFAEAIRAAFDKADRDLSQKLSAIQKEEDEIRRHQQAVISRIQPKLDKLTAIHRKARDIAEGTDLAPLPEGNGSPDSVAGGS
ncbi:MAG: dynamin family protein [Candidatus Hydrogenedentota bacterium]